VDSCFQFSTSQIRIVFFTPPNRECLWLWNKLRMNNHLNFFSRKFLYIFSLNFRKLPDKSFKDFLSTVSKTTPNLVFSDQPAVLDERWILWHEIACLNILRGHVSFVLWRRLEGYHEKPSEEHWMDVPSINQVPEVIFTAAFIEAMQNSGALGFQWECTDRYSLDNLDLRLQAVFLY